MLQLNDTELDLGNYLLYYVTQFDCAVFILWNQFKSCGEWEHCNEMLLKRANVCRVCAREGEISRAGQFQIILEYFGLVSDWHL